MNPIVATCDTMTSTTLQTTGLAARDSAGSSQINRILVATDFSPLSLAGVGAAISMLKGNARAHLTLVHVVEPLPATEMMEFGMPGSLGFLMDGADQEMERLRASLPYEGEISVRVMAGSPMWSINELVTEDRADLIVISSHGRSGLGRALLGSVAEQVVTHAHRPVLVVKPPKAGASEPEGVVNELTWKEILVGYDHRPGSVSALRLAAGIAERSGARLTLVEALEEPDLRLDLNVLKTESDQTAEMTEARMRLQEVKMGYLPASQDWRIDVGVGTPWELMVDRAGTSAADLIVVGPHEHSYRPGDFLGSIAQRLVRHAPCSVLVVR